MLHCYKIIQQKLQKEMKQYRKYKTVQHICCIMYSTLK